MKLSTFLSTASILPILVSASPFDFLDHATQQHQFPLSRLERVPRPSRVERPQESVLVHLVDPASPTTSTVVTPSSIAREALDYSPSDSEEEEEEDDSPNFGAKCVYEEGNPFSVCGDYFSEETQTDHGLFCSPKGICAGKGAVCGSSQACSEGELFTLYSETMSKLEADISSSRYRSRLQSLEAPLRSFDCPFEIDFGISQALSPENRHVDVPRFSTSLLE
jgi:hypothetical protein